MCANRLLNGFFGLIALVSLVACQDHLAPGSPTTRLRVKSLSQDLPNNSAKISAFNYDAQGRLNSLVAYQSPDSTTAQVERNTYQYDAQSRLILHQRQVISVPGSIFRPFSDQNRFSYNATGKVAEIRYSFANFLLAAPNQTIVDLSNLNDIKTLTNVVQTRYNATNQLIGSSSVNYFQGAIGSIASNSEFAYSGENLTFVRVTTTSSSSPSSSRREENSLTYDTKINPFYGVYVIPAYFGGVSTNFPNLATLSRNNITSIGGVSYRYEYNAANLPAVRYTTIADKLVETLRFNYEAY